MAILNVTYQPDNNMIDGMGAILVGGGTSRVALAIAQRYRAKFLAASIEVAEGDARSEQLAPGRIRELFSKAKLVPEVVLLKDLSSGHINPRRAYRVEVTGAYEGKDEKTGTPKRVYNRMGQAYIRMVGGLPKSSPVTIEFGSHYNEGTRGDRPDFRVLANALYAQAAVTVGMNVAETRP